MCDQSRIERMDYRISTLEAAVAELSLLNSEVACPDCHSGTYPKYCPKCKDHRAHGEVCLDCGCSYISCPTCHGSGRITVRHDPEPYRGSPYYNVLLDAAAAKGKEELARMNEDNRITVGNMADVIREQKETIVKCHASLAKEKVNTKKWEHAYHNAQTIGSFPCELQDRQALEDNNAALQCKIKEMRSELAHEKEEVAGGKFILHEMAGEIQRLGTENDKLSDELATVKAAKYDPQARINVLNAVLQEVLDDHACRVTWRAKCNCRACKAARKVLGH